MRVTPRYLLCVIWPLTIAASPASGQQSEYSLCVERHLAEALGSTGSARARDPNAPVPWLATTHNPDASTQALTTHHVEPTATFLVATPRDANEFHLTFDHEPTALEMSAVDRANTRLQSSAGAFQRLDGLKAFTDALENASDNFIVIVGHNDRGRFRFPDGTYKELPVLAQMAVQAHKRVIFISCNTKGVLPGVPGTAGLLTYDEALHVADHLRGAIGQRQRAGRSLSLSDVTQFIQGDLDQAQGQYKSRGHVYYIVCTAGAVGGILVLNSLERADSSSARAP